jgi:serine phosphatase RsbU (regulator of sigma subunit)
VLALAAATSLIDPSPVRALRDQGFDLAQRFWPLPAAGAEVEIVEIDEESLKRVGQWPWPRDEIAQLVRQIAAGKPYALGVDIFFHEPDRFSPPVLAHALANLPPGLAEGLARLPASDAQLGQAFAEVPTVLGEAPTNEEQPSGNQIRHTPVRESGGNPRPYVESYKAMISTLPEISKKAVAEAALTEQTSADGIVRSVPLFTLVGGQLIPTLALQILGIHSSIVVRTGIFGIDSVSLGPVTIPTDGEGRAYLHFARTDAIPHISAATVLDPSLKPGFNVSEFQGKVILLGVTGLGLVDLKLTPLGPTQGIDVHAQLIQSILGNWLLHRPAYVVWIEFAIVLLAGLAVIGLLPYESPRLAILIALLIFLGLPVGEFLAFRYAGWLVDGIYPAIVTVLAAGVMVFGHFRAEQAARRRLTAELAHERELTARTEGELAAARDLQLGLLPHRFPAFPDRTDIDLYARIEPARAVGGDFFDFLLIDESHLFFIIADVSGKGIPAALFMEMTLQIVRSAVQRHECDLEQVMTEANAKTAAASMDMGEHGDGMFVTAFAGIIDTASGEVVYASAGHDSPFLVGAGELRQFVTDGGPPLGVLDEYPYPVDRDHLDPGTVLLLFTDGLTEAQDAAGELYSGLRVSNALKTISPDHARAVVDACFEAVGRFVGGAEQADDITLLAIRLAPG